MKFVERLAKAIKDQDIETVKAMLQVLQMKYDNREWIPIISLFTCGSDDKKLLFPKESKPLGELALESNFEIFKLLVCFFKKNHNSSDNSINHFFYQTIHKTNLTAVKFFVEVVRVDLSKSLSKSYSEVLKLKGIETKTCHSPLEAAADSSEIFQFLFPYCIKAYEVANKHPKIDLLNPLITYLNSKIKEIKKDAQGIQSNVELLKTLEHHLRFTECFKEIYEIFSEKIFVTFIFRNLGQAFPKNPELCIEIVGDLLGKHVSRTSLNIINIFLKIILNMIRERSAEEQILLKKLFIIHVMSHAARIASKYKEGKDLEFFKFLLKREGWTDEKFVQPTETKPEETHLETKKETKTDTTELTDIVKYELACMLFIDNKDKEHKALKVWSDLASKGYEKAFKILKSIADNNPDDIIKGLSYYGAPIWKKFENHVRYLVGNLYYQGIPKLNLSPDITTAIEFWTAILPEYYFIKDDEFERSKDSYFYKRLPNLTNIARDSNVDIKIRSKATNALIRFYFADVDYTNLLAWIDYYNKVLSQASPQFSGFKNAEELNISIDIYFYLLEYQPQENDFESLTEAETKYYSLSKASYIIAVATAIFEGKYGFEQDSNKAAHICLKLFMSQPYFANSILSLLYKIISENNSSTQWLPTRLNKIILEKQAEHSFFSHRSELEATIKILGIASKHGHQDSLEKLCELYRKHIGPNNDSAKKLLNEQFLGLLQQSETVAKFSPRAIEIILSNVILLNNDTHVGLSPQYSTIVPELNSLKSSILIIFALNKNLKKWLAEAQEIYNNDIAKFSYKFFKSVSIPTPETTFTLLLNSSITAINELSNGITTFLKEGTAQLSSKSFLQSDDKIIKLKEINDIYVAIVTFLKKQPEISAPENHPLSTLRKLLFDVTVQLAAEKLVTEKQIELKGLQ